MIDDLCSKYQACRSNLDVLYDVFVEQELTWPSLTVQWQKNVSEPKEAALLLGTQTSNNEPNYIHIIDVSVSDLSPNANGSAQFPRFQHVSSFSHDGDVDRARSLGDNKWVVTKCAGLRLCLYDLSCTSGEEACLATFANKDDFLAGESPALSCNSFNANLVLYSACANRIVLTNIEAVCNQSERHSDVFKHHKNNVTDITWCPQQECVFLSADDGSWMYLWDTREAKRVSQAVQLEKCGINSIAIASSMEPYLIAAALENGSVVLRDNRNLKRPLNILDDSATCRGPVNQVSFSADGQMLAAVDEDNMIQLWNLHHGVSKPNLQFFHAAHLGQVWDLDWHPAVPHLVASVSQAAVYHESRCEQGNVLQLWQSYDLNG